MCRSSFSARCLEQRVRPGPPVHARGTAARACMCTGKHGSTLKTQHTACFVIVCGHRHRRLLKFAIWPPDHSRAERAQRLSAVFCLVIECTILRHRPPGRTSAPRYSPVIHKNAEGDVREKPLRCPASGDPIQSSDSPSLAVRRPTCVARRSSAYVA